MCRAVSSQVCISCAIKVPHYIAIDLVKLELIYKRPSSSMKEVLGLCHLFPCKQQFPQYYKDVMIISLSFFKRLYPLHNALSRANPMKIRKKSKSFALVDTDTSNVIKTAENQHL